MVLEIAVFNIQSAIDAAKAGADRIELCENPFDGGTTPSYGTLQVVRKLVQIPVFPIIRPRGGDFFFSEAEFDVMKEDVMLCKRLGFDGIVIGLLNIDGTIDEMRTSFLVELAYPMEVTFHRAFDRAGNPYDSLETIIDCGCQRILTSGQVPDATKGKDLITQLTRQADDRIIIMPGSGVRSKNILELAQDTGVQELHSSARRMRSSPMQFVVPGMNEHLENISVDVEEIQQMKSALLSV